MRWQQMLGAVFADHRMVIGGAAFFALGIFVTLHFEVTTDLNAFLPSAVDDTEDATVGAAQLGAVSDALRDSRLSRTMTLVLSCSDPARLVEASRVFESELVDALPPSATVQGGPRTGGYEALWALYRTRLPYFFASDAESARTRLDAAGLRRAAAALKGALSSPLAAAVAPLAPHDPFLVLQERFAQLGGRDRTQLHVRDDRFVTQDHQHAVLFLTTKASAFDAPRQEAVMEHVESAFAHALSAHATVATDAPLQMHYSGLGRFALTSARAIKRDVQFVAPVAAVALLALMLAVFRSLRLLGLALFPMGAGLLSGCAAVLCASGRVHGITLALGGALLGVSVDYVLHLYCHHLAASAPETDATWRSVRAPMLTSAVTTLVGFAALALSGVPGLCEVALFACVGLVGALVATWALVLPCLPRSATLSEGMQARARRFRVRASLVVKRPWNLACLAACIILLLTFGLPKLTWNTDFMRMAQLDPGLVEEDARVRKITGFEQGRMIVALGDTEAAALAVNERVYHALQGDIDRGALESFRGLMPWLPSPAAQRAVADEVRRSPAFPDAFKEAFVAAGFRPDGFAPFLQSLGAPLPPPLDFDSLASTPFGEFARSLRIEVEGQVGFVTLLQGVHDADALDRAMDAVAGAYFVDQHALMHAMQSRGERQMLNALFWGLLAALCVLCLRYRNVKDVLRVVWAPVLACLLSVCVLSVAGFGIDMVTLTALLWIFCMGVDYSVFLLAAATRGSQGQGSRVDASMLSVTLACVSTLFGMSALALAQHPMLASLGLAVVTGIGAAAVLAPLGMLWRPRGAL